jgi:hypothetical protein
MLDNFVFDIDGAMAIAVDYQPEKEEKAVKDKFGDEFFKKHCLEALKYPHYIFPGYYALFEWLVNSGGKIFFFSSGIEGRNVELAEKMMKMSFGENVPEYKVFSRQHCIDTSSYSMQEEEKEKYQSFFYGQRKKKLGGIVVPEEEVPNSLLIEDDTSYMVKGEEYNLISLRYCHEYTQEHAYTKEDGFFAFHRAYYLAGLFSKIFEVRESQNITLVEAAKFVQIDSENGVLSRDFYYPVNKKVEYYIKGLEILQRFDPELKFYYDIPKNNDE